MIPRQTAMAASELSRLLKKTKLIETKAHTRIGILIHYPVIAHLASDLSIDRGLGTPLLQRRSLGFNCSCLSLDRRQIVSRSQRLLSLSLKGWRSALNWSRKALGLGSPVSKVILSIVEDLTCLGGVLIRHSCITRDHRRIVEKLQQTAAMFG
jgi:hypothetical protein